jgi:hypothetical protein
MTSFPGLKKLVSVLVVSGIVAMPAPLVIAQSPGTRIADVVVTQLPRSSSVVLLPVANNRLDLSGQLAPVMQETAASLRARGYVVRTFEEAAIERTALRTIGRSGLIGRTSVGRFGNAVGIGLVLLLALAEARQNEMSVTASIYASSSGLYEEIWRSRVNWRDEPKGQIGVSEGVGRCTGNLLVNGDFERDWPIGWKRAYGDLEEGGSVTEVVRGPESQMLHMKHSGLSDVSLYQLVQVPKGRIVFQFAAKLVTREGPIMGFTGTGTAGISLILFDANKQTLGMVWAGSYVRNPFEGTGLVGVPHGPRDTNSASFLEMPNGQTVRERFDVSRFVRDHLGKVDVNQIEYVGVNISVGATHRLAGAEAWVDSLSLEVCPY